MQVSKEEAEPHSRTSLIHDANRCTTLLLFSLLSFKSKRLSLSLYLSIVLFSSLLLLHWFPIHSIWLWQRNSVSWFFHSILTHPRPIIIFPSILSVCLSPSLAHHRGMRTSNPWIGMNGKSDSSSNESRSSSSPSFQDERTLNPVPHLFL